MADNASLLGALPGAPCVPHYYAARQRLGKSKAGVNASPVGADGKVYLATTGGVVAVLSAAPQWEILELNDLGEEIHATPAIAAGSLFVRTKSRLYRFAEADAAVGSR